MAEAIENHIVELERISFGPLRLGELPRGQARLLKPAELRLLWKDSPPSRSKR
jgi:16S rRNA U516 pseudouridylate synthase RsuA-like enzyme